MLFAIDSQAAKLRHEEMLREAANARLAKQAVGANSTGSLLKRMVNLLNRVARRSDMTAKAAHPSHQPTLANYQR